VSTLRDSSSSSPHLKMGWQESGDWDIEATSFYPRLSRTEESVVGAFPKHWPHSEGACLHTTLKPSTQRRLCPPLFVRSFWARPVRDRVGCRVGEEVRGGLAIGEAAGTL
jgi:hypothetical protein